MFRSITRQDAISILRDVVGLRNKREIQEAQDTLTEGGFTGPEWQVSSYASRGDLQDAIDDGRL